MSMIKSATISEDRLYRYTLGRVWDQFLPALTFVMLNPSVADDFEDDPTIRRCVGFAKRANYGGIRVVNAYAYRATDPSHLDEAEDPVGPENDTHLRIAAEDAWGNNTPLVCAWGTNIVAERAAHIMGVFRSARATTVCLGKTKHGHPRHPLYIRADAPFIDYDGVIL